MDADTVDRIQAFLRLRRRRSLTYDEKMDILWLQSALRKEHVTNVSVAIARLLGRSPKTVKAVLAEWLATGDLSVVDPPSNTKYHKARVPNTHAVRATVRSFIRDRSVTRTRTVGKDVLAHLLENGVVVVDPCCPKDYAACLRAVQVFLSQQGYERGKRKGTISYRMTKSHEETRDAYVALMVPTVTHAPRRPVVYLDESFIHHHYSRHADSLYDPTDDATTKPKHKGRRYCFVAGILDDGSDVSHLLGLDIFVGGKKNGKKVEDYHSMFNHDYFVDWFKKLLDEVEELGWGSAVFVMDNAKYHKATGDLSVVDPPSNTKYHKARVPNTHAVRATVRSFIRDRSVTRTRTVGKDVLAHLLENGVVVVDPCCPKDYAACLRAVQVFLSQQGYERGKRKGTISYRMTKSHEETRDAYVALMVPTVTHAPRRPVVYLDESFIHHHYSRHADSLYDPTDDATTKPKHKGRRYCFVAGILDDGSDVSHLLGLDIFVGGKKNGKKVEDYHSMFNHDYFVDWFKKLLDEVEELGWGSAVFVMDNAKYHKGKLVDTPNGNWKKCDMYQACVDLKLPDVSPDDLRTTIWKKLKKYVEDNVQPVVVSMAEARGHHVMYAAPGFSELQPIELVWANVKGTVGRAYTSTTTFKDVLHRLESAFHELDSEVIQSTIASSTTKLLKLDSALRKAEDAAATSNNEGGDSDTSDGEDMSSSSDCSSSSDIDD
ncbi:hypothetical protein H257_14791 [Aphanomyces astaci]|uniref:Tc1-like transposase DDE domain-containing protein n=1 Tax=Aphanomyces astaci TaxID=112090 RepID=W4FQ20_APHAT|nr:hypothetical protein H257_14791 [Aphanomyces astaci]ETV69555.1 hypothetical protein H257_14791 [Aphanomyces astaci]|eukprot:XP_009840979.1 hypothetical protein H257_14791 [Aphanomyces astaci]